MEDTKKEVEKKDEGRKDTRLEKRLKERFQKQLDALVLEYFTKRSALIDPNGEESADLFSFYRKEWIHICAKHNKLKSPLKMNYSAFDSSVEFFVKQEEQNIKSTEAANRLKDFSHWFRRSRLWRTRPFSCILNQVKAKFNQEKYLSLWREYYLNEVVPTFKQKLEKVAEAPKVTRPDKPEGYYTCDKCSDTEICEYAFDEYNSKGDCLAVK